MVDKKMLDFFNESLEKHTFIRSRTLAMDYMENILNMPSDCRKCDSEAIRKQRESIIIKFTKIMKNAIQEKKVKKHNAHIYKVLK